MSTIGSSGDLRPFLALAKGLQSRRHEPRVLSYGMYEELANREGVPFLSIAPNVTKDAITQMVQDGLASGNPLKQAKLLLTDIILKDSRIRYQECMKAFQTADVILCHALDFPAQAAAVQAGVPWVNVGFCPFFLETSERAPDLEKIRDLGAFLNRRLWRLAAWIEHHVVFRMAAEFCASVGYSRRGRWTWVDSPYLNICASSPGIGGVPRDLPQNFLVPGAWELEEDEEENAAVNAFLADGPAPVVVTFGSMGDGDPQATVRTLLDATRAVGVRAIIQQGWGNLTDSVKDSARQDALFIGHFPHKQLFSRAQCVVHHGGAGTTIAAARAGIPSIVVVHGADQYFWAQCLERRKAAAKPLRRRRLTTAALRDRLVEVLGNASIKDGARLLGEAVAAEQGVATSIDALEALVGRSQLRR